jgi:hypothetical protein
MVGAIQLDHLSQGCPTGSGLAVSLPSLSDLPAPFGDEPAPQRMGIESTDARVSRKVFGQECGTKIVELGF